MSDEHARNALEESGIGYEVVRHGPVRSLAEAAAARGVESSAVIKTMVVRRAEDDYVFVLVPGDRNIAWPKLRALLGVNRLSMPDAATAKDVTGYERGTITPFGSSRHGRSSPTSGSPAGRCPSVAGRTVCRPRSTAMRSSVSSAPRWPT